jgi:hypothetical protein
LCLLDAVRKISIRRTRGALSRERNSALSSASQEAVHEISVRRMRALQLGGVSALSCAFWMLCTRFLFAERVLLQLGTISSVVVNCSVSENVGVCVLRSVQTVGTEFVC